MSIQKTDEFGRIEIATIPVPAFVKEMSATYTYSGSVLLHYRTDDDPSTKDYYNFAVLNDDGSNFRVIFSGAVPQHEKANGIRAMPFADNKRVLLGDYVLECSPSIDACNKAELIPVKYPAALVNDPCTWKHWSEVIIAPDNEHMAWTTLRSDGVGAINFLGALQREKDGYVIERVQVISTLEAFKEDDANPGYIIPQPIRGGEVKQFVRGGTAISLVGAKEGYVADSVVQDLLSEEILQITRTPGYDETTIFSPDERLGLVMTSRGSKRTDPAILGWMPRPYAHLVTQGLTMYLYMYAVTGVRTFRPGNIGPALIDIERSMREPGYQGVLLHDPDEEWVYVSPMSWHPNGKKAIWMEMVRGSQAQPGGIRLRIRQVTLHDYEPGPVVPVRRTPDEVPYALKRLEAVLTPQTLPNNIHAGKIAGKHSGYIAVRLGEQNSIFSGERNLVYHHFSDDGETFFDGFEKVFFSFTSGCRYEADVKMRGRKEGEMKLRIALSGGTFENPPRLLFDLDNDGRPQSDGYVKYNGSSLRVNDLLP